MLSYDMCYFLTETMMWRTLIVLCVSASVFSDEEWREVKISQGLVRGQRDPLGVYKFSNIPYATVPKGSHMFGAPLPAPAWLAPLEVSEKRIICPQVLPPFVNPQDVLMQEECLIANVYVPITDEKQLPVLVYIHGGAYQIGFGEMMTPRNFVKQKNIIVVTFNYRLGAHGFLCLGTDNAPGNSGLKDQVALLNWVQNNIASFGGDPDKVTIAGYSAGSVSADLLMLAKSTEGLFNGVILESGATVGSIAIQRNPLENAKGFAQKLNFTNTDDIYALEEFYNSSPLESLLLNSFLDRKDASALFGPCIERKSSSAFLEDSPVNIIINGKYRKVPILLGVTNMEGMLHLPVFNLWKNEMNEKFSTFVPSDLHFKNEVEKEAVAKAIKEFYFGDKAVGDDTILSFIDYLSDTYFRYPTLRSVKLHAENGHNDLYLYEYNFVNDDTNAVPHTDARGADHCAQTAAIFDGVGLGRKDERNLSVEFKKMKATIREFWYNFIVHGQPVPEGSKLPSWPPAGADRSPHMSLGQTVELKGPLLETTARFWEDIYQKYYSDPIPPPTPPHTEL